MKRTEWLQETRMLRFGEALEAWTENRLTQGEAARLLGVCARTFRRYVDRYEESGIDGLVDKRVSALRAPVDEVVRLEALYRNNNRGWPFTLPWGRRHALLVVLGHSRLLWLRFYPRQTMAVLTDRLDNNPLPIAIGISNLQAHFCIGMDCGILRMGVAGRGVR